MTLYENTFVNCIMVIKSDKGEAAGFFCDFVGDDLDLHDAAIVVEVGIEIYF
jgi:hypothetical protein